jgi:hypothetical protein
VYARREPGSTANRMTRAKPMTPVVARTRSVAHALAVVPAAIDDGDRAELRRHFSEADAEWIVLLCSDSCLQPRPPVVGEVPGEPTRLFEEQ